MEWRSCTPKNTPDGCKFTIHRRKIFDIVKTKTPHGMGRNCKVLPIARAGLSQLRREGLSASGAPDMNERTVHQATPAITAG